MKNFEALYAEAERERNALAYRLLQVQDANEKLDAALDRATEQSEKQAPVFDQIRARLGPLSGLDEWQRLPLLSVVDAVARRLEP